MISASTEKQELSSRSSSGSKEIRRLGAINYLQKEAEYGEEWLQEVLGRYHTHYDGDSDVRCSSVVVQRVEAPVSVVWSLVRRFEKPQIYKNFIRTCCIRGDGDSKVKVGCLREVRVVSGLPAATSIERLDILDEEQHILSFSIVGGEHRLNNYRSMTTLHERLINGKPGTIVIESYLMDVPQGNTKEEACLFVETIIESNLRSLARVSESLINTERRV